MRVGASSALASEVLSSAFSARRSNLPARIAVVDDGPHQREAVAVEAARGEPDDRVALADRGAVDQPLALDHADAEADQLELALRVDAGHRGRLAAEQRAAGAPAALGDAAQRLRAIARSSSPIAR